MVRIQIDECYSIIFLLSSWKGSLNHVLNLVLLTLTMIENDLFGSVLAAIFVKHYFHLYNENIIFLCLIWYIECIKSTSIFTVVFLLLISHVHFDIIFPCVFTAKINDNKTVVSLHIARMIIENIINVLQLLRKKTDEICIFSNCLMREFEVVLS